jgi:hypothetical protein
VIWMLCDLVMFQFPYWFGEREERGTRDSVLVWPRESEMREAEKKIGIKIIKIIF